MGGQATSNLLAARLTARVPSWEQIGHVGYLSNPPLDLTEGTDPLDEAPRTHLWVAEKYRNDRRTAWVYIETLDITATYTLTVDTVAYAYDAAANNALSKADILDGLYAVIQTAGPAGWDAYKVQTGAITTALRLESTPSGDTSAPSDFDVDTAPAATASGVMQVFAEVDPASGYDLDVYATAVRGRSDGPPDSEQWFKIKSAINSGTVPQVQILNTAGMERLAIAVTSFTLPVGDAVGVLPAFYIFVGPAADETVEA